MCCLEELKAKNSAFMPWLLGSYSNSVLSPAKALSYAAGPGINKAKFCICWEKGTQTKEALTSWKAKLPERLVLQLKQSVDQNLEKSLSMKDTNISAS